MQERAGDAVTGMEEMLASWRVAFLHFSDGASVETVNEAIGKHPGWEPFTALRHHEAGWVLWLKRAS